MLAHQIEPAVSRVASQCKRWIAGTLQGAVEPEHLQAYCHEFEFRWNRRRAQARGLLFYRLMQQAVRTKPTTYRQLVKNPGLDPDQDKPTPPDPWQRSLPLSLDQPDAERPGRQHWQAGR
jgi:hypothetical protein